MGWANYTKLKSVYKKIVPVTAPLAFITILYYLPILTNSKLLLERGNDLEEQFWPVYYYIRTTLFKTGQLPLWNKMFFSGIPILSDSQYSYIYPFHWLMILLPTSLGFLIFFPLHTFLAGIFTYLLAKRCLKFSYKASLFSAIIYMISPKMVGFIEAGHKGLSAASAWIPLLLFGIIMMAKNPKKIWAVVVALSLSAIYLTHPVIFGLSVALWFTLYFLAILKSREKVKKLRMLGFATVVISVFLLPSLLSQLKWTSETTRTLLIQNPDVYPKWHSVKEIISNIAVPWTKDFQNIDSEKWLTFGIVPLILSIFAFLKLNLKTKIITVLLLLGTFLFILNNLSPLYPFLLNFQPYALMRVVTRIWFIPVIIFSILSGYAIHLIDQKSSMKSLVFVLFGVVVLETLFISWIYLTKPTADKSRLAVRGVYEYLAKDDDIYRVFCTTRCLSQKQVAIYNLETIEGYNTLQQINYYQHMWQLTGEYWDYYTLALPPIGIYTHTKIQPEANHLGNYNVKYVVSPHLLVDDNFVLEKEFGNFLIYKNSLFKSRSNYPIAKYTPNEIIVNIDDPKKGSIILRNVYSPGWKAYLDGKEKVPVQETPIHQQLVDINSDTKTATFKY